MRELVWKALRLTIDSPIALAMWAWTILTVLASFAISMSAPMFFGEIGKEFTRAGASFGELLTAAFFVVCFIGGAAFVYYITWISGSATLAATRDLREDAREVADSTREVLAARAEEAARIDAQAGQMSLSLGDGGGLSEIAPDEGGLALVDEGVALDLGEDAGEERAAEASEVSP